MTDDKRSFVHQLIDVLGLAGGDAAMVLRQRVVSAALNGRRLGADDVLRYAFTAWNHFRAGRVVTMSQAPEGGWTRANFPTPR